FQRTDGEPSTSAGDAQPPAAAAPAPAAAVTTSAAVLPGVLLSADELCAMAGIGRDQLADLMSYGVLTSTSNRPEGPFDDEAVEIASASKLLLDAGLEARHLRGWRVAADREAGLLEQLIQPLLRQRNPEARAQAVSQLNELEQVGSRLRSALMRSALHHHGTP
ncbi:MAG: hypothetical protein WCA90_14740, partial [Ilumatobacteraceae bacterium]